VEVGVVAKRISVLLSMIFMIGGLIVVFLLVPLLLAGVMYSLVFNGITYPLIPAILLVLLYSGRPEYIILAFVIGFLFLIIFFIILFVTPIFGAELFIKGIKMLKQLAGRLKLAFTIIITSAFTIGVSIITLKNLGHLEGFLIIAIPIFLCLLFATGKYIYGDPHNP